MQLSDKLLYKLSVKRHTKHQEIDILYMLFSIKNKYISSFLEEIFAFLKFREFPRNS